VTNPYKVKPLRVFVCRNIHNGMFSVRSVDTGRVLFHAQGLLLKNATFKVSAKGRARVLTSGQKNIHAGVLGELVTDPTEIAIAADRCLERVRYDPRRDAAFVDSRGREVGSADYALFTMRSVFIDSWPKYQAIAVDAENGKSSRRAA
jgi:hypothetical protein